jgi:hypothetical protein
MKRYDIGAGSLDKPTPIGFAGAAPDLVTSGAWLKYF